MTTKGNDSGSIIAVRVAIITGVFALLAAFFNSPFANRLAERLFATTTFTPTPVNTEHTVAVAVSATPLATPTFALSVTSSVAPSPAWNIVTPPSSIADPLCPRTNNLQIRFPSNGSTVDGTVQVLGIVNPRFSGAWYSLFYRVGIIREPMDTLAQNNVPRKGTPVFTGPNPVNGNLVKNYEIVFYEKPAIMGFGAPVGVWDTTKVPNGWYTVRLWLRETDDQFLACDAYWLVMNK